MDNKLWRDIRDYLNNKIPDTIGEEGGVEIDDYEGLLSQEYIRIRFSLVLRLLRTQTTTAEHEYFSPTDMEMLVKQFHIACPIIECLAKERSQTPLENLKLSIPEFLAVLWCLYEMIKYSDFIKDHDFAEDIHNLMHSFVKSIPINNPPTASSQMNEKM